MLSHRADKRALPIADRHYNRQKIGSPQFVPPGRCAVFLTPNADALWVTSWPFAEYTKHAWAGAWVCSCFRNESSGLSSDLNRQAVAATGYVFGDPPSIPSIVGPVGMVSFINRDKVKPTMVRGKPTWGYSWFKAGWKEIGETKGGLLALGLPLDEVASPEPYLGTLFTYLYAEN